MRLAGRRSVSSRLSHSSFRGPFRWAALVLLALTVAYAWPVQITGYNQNAHYALTKALAEGTPYIDGVIGEVGDLSTGDAARFDGHLYAVKAPGFAAAILPAYVAVEAVGMRTSGDPARAMWVLHLLGSVLPTVALVLLLFFFGERTEPGYGLAGATVFGVATLALPFGTLLFAHALSAALGFAAFVVLWRERAGPWSAPRVAAGGLIAGLAIFVEYQLLLLAAILGAYAVARSAPARRGLAYAAGLLAGVLPLLAFQWWAYRSPFHTPYDDYWAERGLSHLGALPRLDRAADFLFSSMGLLVVTPVVVPGIVGAWLLARRGLRAEALVIGATIVSYGVYFSHLGAFGGYGPPRYLLTVVPFAAAGLAVALRAFPATTIVLAALSAFQVAVMTATGPLAAYDGNWLGRLADRQFMETGASLVGITGWYAIVPFFAALALAVVGAVAGSHTPRVRGREAAVAVGTVLVWALLAFRAPNRVGASPSDAYVLAAVLASGLVLAAVGLGGRSLPHVRERIQPAGLGR
jgi:hypothetical protein